MGLLRWRCCRGISPRAAAPCRSREPCDVLGHARLGGDRQYVVGAASRSDGEASLLPSGSPPLPNEDLQLREILTAFPRDLPSASMQRATLSLVTLCFVTTGAAWVAPAPRMRHSAPRMAMSPAQAMSPAWPPKLATATLDSLKLKTAPFFAPVIAAFVGASPFVKAGVGLAAVVLVLALVRMEMVKRSNLIQAGEDCMSGSTDACEIYDDNVETTPLWKLKLALNKLASTNVLANKLAGPPPAGFKWGSTY